MLACVKSLLARRHDFLHPAAHAHAGPGGRFQLGCQPTRYFLLYPNRRPNGVMPVGGGIDGSDCAVAAAFRAFEAVKPNAARSTSSAQTPWLA